MPTNESPDDVYFYADEEEAEVYDHTIGLTQPGYDLLHDGLLALVREHVKAAGRPELLVLDLACGTGREAFAVLEHLPNATVVAVDISRPMLEVMDGKCAELDCNPLAQGRLRSVRADLRVVEEETARALDVLGLSQDQRFDVVMSAFAFHHFGPDECADLYHGIARVLTTNGLMVNADLFDFHPEVLSSFAGEHLESWIGDHLKAEALASPAGERLNGRVDGFRKRWLDHIRTVNIPFPIERPHGGVNGPSHEELLYQAGFRQVGVPVRLWQGAVLMARK